MIEILGKRKTVYTDFQYIYLNVQENYLQRKKYISYIKIMNEIKKLDKDPFLDFCTKQKDMYDQPF